MRIPARTLFAGLALAAALLSGCKLKEFLDKLDPLANLDSQPGRLDVRPEPVIRAGDHRERAIWNDPHVLKENGRYVMYLTTSVGEPFKPPVLPFRAVSDDGIEWRLDPEQPLLDPAGTPFASIETPSVVRFNGRYHMFYTGVYAEGVTPPMAIGRAVSEDGVRWTSDKEPLLQATGNFQDWNGYLVGEPGAVVYKGKILLYFSAVGARPSGNPPQLQSIGLVTSADGVRFDAPRKVLEQAATYPADKGFVGYSTPAAFVFNERVHLLYDVAHFNRFGNPQWQQVALHHAVSKDGGASFVQDRHPLLTRKDFSWTTGELLAPTALVDGGRIRIWFSGHVALGEMGPLAQRGWKGGEFGIGYGTAEIGRFMSTDAK
jgi:hypothetical protein